MHKILVVGSILLFLSSGCLPHIRLLPEKGDPSFSPAQEEKPSLFTQAELEQIFSEDQVFSQTEPGTFSPSSVQEGTSISQLELPIGDESNDDFNLEILPGDRPKKEPEFDIRIFGE